MNIKSLSHYLIETDIFMDHVLKNYNITNIASNLNDNIQLQNKCNSLKEVHNIDIYPYCFIIEEIADEKQRKMFYLCLNYYLNMIEKNHNIRVFNDIKTLYDILCYIFMVQYFFL